MEMKTYSTVTFLPGTSQESRSRSSYWMKKLML